MDGIVITHFFSFSFCVLWRLLVANLPHCSQLICNQFTSATFMANVDYFWKLFDPPCFARRNLLISTASLPRHPAYLRVKKRCNIFYYFAQWFIVNKLRLSYEDLRDAWRWKKKVSAFIFNCLWSLFFLLRSTLVRCRDRMPNRFFSFPLHRNHNKGIWFFFISSPCQSNILEIN